MKVLILGGAGGMAMGGATYLVRYEDVSSVVLSDIDLDAANRMAKVLDSDKVSTMKLDVLNKEELIKTAQKFDVVLNCVGPFTKFGVPILETIIEAGVNYVDICDDHDAAADLLELDEKAKEAGITALICMGTTPGISNVQAKFLYDKLDRCDVMKIAWAITTPPADMAKGTRLERTVNDPMAMMTDATWDHLLHVGSGKIPVWKDGKMDEMEALEHGEWVDFATPLGRAESYYIGHAEPITLSHFLDIKEFSGCLGSIMPEVMKKLRVDARGHEDAINPPAPTDKPVWKAPEMWNTRGVWGGQAAIVEGMEGDEKVRYTCRIMMGIVDGNAFNNSGQAIGTYMMGKGMFDQKGVVAPEAVIDPEKFFEELAEYFSADSGDNITVDDLILVEREVL